MLPEAIAIVMAPTDESRQVFFLFAIISWTEFEISKLNLIVEIIIYVVHRLDFSANKLFPVTF